jgi:hypothetical protein
MGCLWENLASSWATMRHHGGVYGNFMGLYGLFYGKFMDPPSHKIRLLDPRLYKGNPFKQLQFMELDQVLWNATLMEKPIKLHGILHKIRPGIPPYPPEHLKYPNR